MKASELKIGKTYKTCWNGDTMTYIGAKVYDDYNWYTGEPTHDVRHEFGGSCGGSTFLEDDDIEWAIVAEA